MKLLSIVIPVFNEALAINDNLAKVISALQSDNAYEFILVDDGSTDATFQLLTKFKIHEPRLKIVSFTRNFGKEAAIHAGLAAATGDAAIVMDSDLQHPPELIKSLCQYWQQGFKVVEAIKSNRGHESFKNKFAAKGFYKLMDFFADMPLEGHSDFKLLDREVITAYLALPEKQRFFRALVHWLGYPAVQVPFEVADRSGGGSSRWAFKKLITYALKNLTTFSSAPLRLVLHLGLGTLLFGLIFAGISLWQKLNGQALTGFTTVNLLIVVLGGATLISLGIIGHYLSLIYEEIKGRPAYVIKSNR